MTKQKHIFLDIKIQCGEYVFHEKSVHKIGSGKSIDKFARDYASGFYGGKSSEDFPDSFFFNAGEVATSVDNSKEITEEEYKVLNKFL